MGEKEGERVLKSACRMCHGICGVLVHIRDGRVVKVTGDRDCPTSNGYICAKGRASVELLYHPDRLQFPLKRIGARGENKWQRISWNEALDIVAGKLLKFKEELGPQAIGMAQGTGRPYTNFFARFRHCLGRGQSIRSPAHLLHSQVRGIGDDMRSASCLRLLWFWRCVPQVHRGLGL